MGLDKSPERKTVARIKKKTPEREKCLDKSPERKKKEALGTNTKTMTDANAERDETQAQLADDEDFSAGLQG